ncbi:MAG: hypothetical protein MHMPM18_003782 [Marteilia pararefringens]
MSKENNRDIHNYNPSDGQKSQSIADLCSICLHDIKRPAHPSSCDHIHCFDCLTKWSLQSNSCPICKSPFLTINYQVTDNDQHDQIGYCKFPIDVSKCANWVPVPALLPDGSTAITFEDMTEEEYYMMMLRFRKFIYTSGKFGTLPNLGTNSSTAVYFDASPQVFREKPALLHRIVPFIARELSAIFGTQSFEELHFFQILIVKMLKKFHIDSPEFSNLLGEYLHQHNKHFIYELSLFIFSTLGLKEFDRCVDYGVEFSPRFIFINTEPDQY